MPLDPSVVPRVRVWRLVLAASTLPFGERADRGTLFAILPKCVQVAKAAAERLGGQPAATIVAALVSAAEAAAPSASSRRSLR